MESTRCWTTWCSKSSSHSRANNCRFIFSEFVRLLEELFYTIAAAFDATMWLDKFTAISNIFCGPDDEKYNIFYFIRSSKLEDRCFRDLCRHFTAKEWHPITPDEQRTNQELNPTPPPPEARMLARCCELQFNFTNRHAEGAPYKKRESNQKYRRG